MATKQKSYKATYKTYLEKGVKLKRYQKIGIGLLVVVAAGFVGWAYEVLLALGETGSFHMRGGNFLPWINIYAIGALLVIPTTYKFRRKPWAVFLISALVTGVVELVGGWLVYTFAGYRLWNYDHDLWLIGSIDGHVCLLSVTIFAVFSMILIYFILPTFIYLANRMSRRAFLILAIAIFSLFMLDEIGNLTLRSMGKPNAMDFYRSKGIEY